MPIPAPGAEISWQGRMALLKEGRDWLFVANGFVDGGDEIRCLERMALLFSPRLVEPDGFDGGDDISKRPS